MLGWNRNEWAGASIEGFQEEKKIRSAEDEGSQSGLEREFPPIF